MHRISTRSLCLALRHDGIKWINQVFLPDGQFMNNFDGITILIALQLAPIIILLRGWWRKQSAMDGFHHRFRDIVSTQRSCVLLKIFFFDFLIVVRLFVFKRMFEISDIFKIVYYYIYIFVQKVMLVLGERISLRNICSILLLIICKRIMIYYLNLMK